jgi:membrane protease YdiL (CAAX protease family)
MTHDENDPPSLESHGPPEPRDPLAQQEPAEPSIDAAFEPIESDPPPGITLPWIAPALPDDLRVPWGWRDLLLLVGVAAIGTVVIQLILVAVLALRGIPLSRLQNNSDGVALLAAIAAQVVIDFALLGYMAAQIRFWYHRPFWWTIGWRPIKTEKYPPAIAYMGLAFGGFILVAIVSLASSAFPPGHPLPIENIFQYRPAVLMYMFAAVFVAPLVEEILFRGYLYPVVARTFGIGGGIAIVGTLFGLLHSVQLWGGWWQIALLVFVGVVLTAVRAGSGTLVASYIVHLIYNSVQVVAFLFATQGGRHLP